MPSTITYRRIPHAAHPPGRDPWDLEQWTVEGRWTDPRPEGVAPDAERHHGFVSGGVQHVVWTRVAPPTGPCARCNPVWETVS